MYDMEASSVNRKLMACGGLNILGCSIGSGTIRRCGLVGVGVSLCVWALIPSS